MRSKTLMPVAAGLILAASAPAFAAGTKTTTMGVSAAVAGNCVVSASNLAFGPYDGSAALTGSAPIVVRCTNGTVYDVLLSTGGGTYTQRLLSDGGTNTLQYNLYTTSGATTVWGDGATSSSGKVTWTGTGLSSNGAYTHTVHGVLPNSTANQDAPVGNYSDSITVTVNY
jgi:spore coat protein U-like protein